MAQQPTHVTPVPLPRLPWRERLQFYVETAREMSAQTEPQAMVQSYGRRMQALSAVDGSVSLSRRGLPHGHVRVTRASIWGTNVNPWTSDAAPVIHTSGLFARLIWGDGVTILDDAPVPADDPAAPFCAGMRAFLAIPLFDQGVALNMVVLMRRDAGGFEHELIPERVMMSNLFGRATHNLVLKEQLQLAYDAADRELRTVEDIQRSLLPSALPRIPGVELAAYYRTSRRAGGDYYDFFPLPSGEWGILMADVSGHGTPAAVLMAVTHSIAHTHHGPPEPPADLMRFVNRHLAARYTNANGKFVTAFYGIYDPAARVMRYTSAGHCPPRVRRRDGTVEDRFGEAGLPLGIDPDERYPQGVVRFEPGEVLAFYTDGITEARSSATSSDLFGMERLDAVLTTGGGGAEAMLQAVLHALDSFTSGAPPADDQTLLLATFN